VGSYHPVSGKNNSSSLEMQKDKGKIKFRIIMAYPDEKEEY